MSQAYTPRVPVTPLTNSEKKEIENEVLNFNPTEISRAVHYAEKKDGWIDGVLRHSTRNLSLV